MIPRKAGWLILEVLLCLFFLYFGSSGALAIALLLVMIPLCSLPLHLYIRNRISLTVETAGGQRKGDEGSVRIQLENPTIFPLFCVFCEVIIQNQLNMEEKNWKLMTYIVPGATQCCTFRMKSEFCGRFHIRISRIMLYDCFGLIGIRCKKSADTNLTIFPESFDIRMTWIPTPDNLEDSENYSQERPGADLSETFQIREYASGDSPRQIHWKLTNKFDKLIVRDPGLPISRQVLVFWERTGDTDDPELIDTQVEVVASVCRSLADRGIPFYIGWNDPDRNLCRIYRILNLDELAGIMPRLLKASGGAHGCSGADLLIRTRPDALCAHMVYIAYQPQGEVADMQHYGRVTMLVCGKTVPEGAIRFDQNSCRQQLMQMEI